MVVSRFKTVREFVDHVGRASLKGQGAYAQIVHNWIQDGEISSRWIPVFTHLYGPDLPLQLFNVRRAKLSGPLEHDPP